MTVSDARHLGALRRGIARLQPLLDDASRDGFDQFITRRDRHRSKAIDDVANAFPMIEEASWWEVPDPSLWVVRRRLRGGVSTDVLDRFLTNLLWSEAFEDNRNKLKRAGTTRRHLFLWIEKSEFTPWLSLCESNAPQSHPDLPPEVTDLWIAADCPEGLRVWWVAPPSPWTDVTSEANPEA